MDQTQQQANLTERRPTGLSSCVAGLVNALAKVTVDLVRPHGLIPSEFALLRLFLGNEQWTATQLAHALPVRTSRISRMVAKLVDMGLMSRRRPSSDRRAVFLTLTGKGRTLTLDIQRDVRPYEAVLSEGVTEGEMAVFVSVTSRVMGNYAALRRPGGAS